MLVYKVLAKLASGTYVCANIQFTRQMRTASWGSLKTHARGINEKDLGTRSLLSGYLGHAICMITWEAYEETW